MTRPETGARIGPYASATGGITIWTRIIRGRSLTFWSLPNQIAVYLTPDNEQLQLVRTFPKET